MSVIVWVIGILITGAGLAALGFGIPINDLAIGQTLIIAGTTGLAAGLILIGLAAAVSQLTQIAGTLKGKNTWPPIRATEAEAQPEMPAALPAPGMHHARTEPASPRPEPQVEYPELPVQRPEPAVRPPVPRPAEVRSPEGRAGEGQVDVSANAIERLRTSLPRPDRVVPEGEGVPLSPNGGAHPPVAPAVEPKTNEPVASNPVPADGPREPRLDFLFRSRQPRGVQNPENFDAVWPKRSGRQGEAGGRGAETQGAKAERPEPPAPARPEPAAPAAETRSAAILKSGVVDGMAYTLYADGSIEAQLPQGTVRFGSILELREHIENNS